MRAGIIIVEYSIVYLLVVIISSDLNLCESSPNMKFLEITLLISNKGKVLPCGTRDAM